ncbi:hypothetical protein NBRC3280_3390 [Acetobacter pasteurianus NBRC 3280]|nr:hypothetical protein NBRC3277_3411 [Acetobacter pasteurianus NBRC 3277]GCD70755.1 hypothetical protein NBRC3280_3390 [Acetobacter pasteurianus NBRC 3280]
MKGRALFPQDRAHRNAHTGDQIDQFRTAGRRFQIFDGRGLDPGIADQCQHVARRAAGRVVVDHDGHEQDSGDGQQEDRLATRGAQSSGLPAQQSLTRKSIRSRRRGRQAR